MDCENGLISSLLTCSFLSRRLKQSDGYHSNVFEADVHEEEKGRVTNYAWMPNYYPSSNPRRCYTFTELVRIHSSCRLLPTCAGHFIWQISVSFPAARIWVCLNNSANTDMFIRLVNKALQMAPFPQPSPLHHRVAVCKFQHSLWQMFTA